MRKVVELEKLRHLRSRAEELLSFAATDLRPFLHPIDKVTFLRTPASERKKNDVNVTTTCSCMMALALTNKFKDVYKGNADNAAKAFALITDAPWKSSGLVENNAFTTTLVIRTLGSLLEAGISDPRVSTTSRVKRWILDSDQGSKKKTMSAIAIAMSSHEKRFSINKYPPSAAVIYWFIDGVDRARISLSLVAWTEFCVWAREEFNHQLSLVVAEHEAMMDPVAMAMSACLCARLRFIIETGKPPVLKPADHSHQLALLPSTIELENAIEELVKHQRNGIWPKYFPLFHYDEAGSNFCFTFELLEAVLVEFGREKNELLDNDDFITGLEKAVTWCQRNRLKCRGKSGKQYSGWNSGGYLETLKKGQPESWATAVVYMFLWELQKALSKRIQKRLLDKYKVPGHVTKNSEALDRFLTVEILESGRSRNLKRILRDKIVSKYQGESEETMRKKRVKAPRSALLFGPPGTSKTQVVQAVAKELGWPLIQIDPSHFLRKSLEGIYVQAGEIFGDLMDLSGAVVLFDEMDALVQTRDSDNKLDTAAQFLTTFMLPKILDLHDRGRVVFFMATNFQHKFDPAIKRPGRFDLLLCMGPPPLNVKLNALERFTGEAKGSKEAKAAVRVLTQYVERLPKLKAQLELYTFAEFESLIKALRAGHNSLSTGLETRGANKVEQFVKIDSKSAGLQLRDLEPLRKLNLRFDTIAQIKRLDLNRDEVKAGGVEKETPIIQYVIDRRQSRIPQE